MHVDNLPAPTPADHDQPRWTETLRNQVQVLIRPVRKEDAAAESAFIEALSPQARRYRFLGQVGHPGSAMIKQLTDLDFVDDIAFAAVVRDDGDDQDKFVGVARYNATPDGASCECAVTVLDAWQGQGLGSVLMKHLIAVARSRGIKHMWSMDSAENMAMADLAEYFGFERSADPDDSTQVFHRLEL